MWTVKQPSEIIFGENASESFSYPEQCLVITSKGTKSRRWLEHLKIQNQEIFDNVDEYVTSSGLSLCISKQKLVSKILTISKEDTIKISISTPVYVKNETKKIYQELMKM